MRMLPRKISIRHLRAQQLPNIRRIRPMIYIHGTLGPQRFSHLLRIANKPATIRIHKRPRLPWIVRRLGTDDDFCSLGDERFACFN